MKNMWLTFVLILLLTGCAGSAVRTAAPLPPVPQTPGAVVTTDYICLPQREAGELLLWVEHAEDVCR